MRRIRSKILAAVVFAAVLITMPHMSQVVQASPAQVAATESAEKSSSGSGDLLPLAEVSIGSLATALVVATILQKQDRNKKKKPHEQ